MKNVSLILLTAFALFSISLRAEIEVTEDLSTYGYIDMAAVDLDDGEGSQTDISEFELGLSFMPVESDWSAVSEISFNGDDASFETVTITYAATEELSFTAGNILSYQGFETYDATGLYQFSYSGPGPLYSAGYAVGASADYVTDEFAAGVWVGDTDSDLSFEFLLAYTGVEGLTAKVIYADDPGYETFNFWASYEVGNLTLAGEYVDTDYEGFGDFNGFTEIGELESYMFLAYYSFGNPAITLRYSSVDTDNGDYDKITVCPSYTFSDNVLGLIEVSWVDDGASDPTEVAAELLFTF
ncbi:MAG: hypothetical protein KJT03_11330 [Verrucomicrobiae bacterium]|nr:hypothetical protein [Verrucomicrobiae bacterium]